jgi:hypothetical protein
MDIKLEWRQMREFSNSSSPAFKFTEIGGQNVWSGMSTLGFVVNEVAAHGSVVMTVCEADASEGQMVDDLAKTTWTQEK